MRILFVSGELTGSALCQKLIAEGNEIKLFILRQPWKQCYSGIVEKTNDWKQELAWVGKDGLVIFDDVVFGPEQDRLRKDGYTVVGGSAGGDILEHDRKFFQEVLENYGIQSLPLHRFDSPDEAILFVIQNPAQWVVKQTSHMSSHNFIGSAQDGSDAIRVLKRYQERNISPIYLQKFTKGIEVGVARYFNGNDWVGPIEINHEHKRLHDGNVGPLTPEMGTVLWYTDTEIPLFKQTLGVFKPYLQQIDFRGDFDINFIVNKEGAWPLEATPRFGCPSTEIQIALHESPWTDFLTAVGQGKPYDLKYKKDYGIAVSMVTSPYPYEPENLSEMGATTNPKRLTFSDTLNPIDFEHIHFEEISKDTNGHHWSGKHGILLHITAHGETLYDAQQTVYERVKKIHFDGMYYRKDIGTEVLTHDIPRLREMGWI